MRMSSGAIMTLVLAMVAALAANSAFAQQASTFQKSCSGITVVVRNDEPGKYERAPGQEKSSDGKLVGIEASCQTSSGAARTSFVPLGWIHNVDGRLSHILHEGIHSTFHRTCRDYTITLDGPSGVTLRATCQNKAGTWASSSTSIWDIHNIEGNLRYSWKPDSIEPTEPASSAPAVFPQRDGDDAAPTPGNIFELSIPRTQPTLTNLVAASGEADAARNGLVVFASTDGSAAYLSRSVFMLRNVASGETILAPVDGAAADTLAEFYVTPGTYEVIPPAPSVNGYSSFYTSRVSETRITVDGSDIPKIIEFSLGSQTTPVAMRVDAVSSNSVSLTWDALPDVSVGSYTLVRTDGDDEAAGADAGPVVARGQSGTTSAVVSGLASNRKYTFTLFSTASDGSDLATRSVTASTARQTGSTVSSYALAPNTIVPDNYASLRVESVSETSIRVALPASVERASSSALPGVTSASLEGNGCVVGTPFLVTTDVAGDNSFYGLIDACEGPATGATSAIVNRDVPLTAVFDYFMLDTGSDTDCFDAMTGEKLSATSEVCTAVPHNVEPVGVEAFPAMQAGADMAEGSAGTTLPFAGETNLVRDQRYWSRSGSHYLVFQADGNLVVYRAGGGYVWGLDRQPNTDFRRIARVTWQADGNLAAYAADNQWVWSALHRNPDPNARLILTDQGDLQIVAGNRVMWSALTPLSSNLRDQPTDAGASFRMAGSLASPTGQASGGALRPAYSGSSARIALAVTTDLKSAFQENYFEDPRPDMGAYGMNSAPASVNLAAAAMLPAPSLAQGSRVSCEGSGSSQFDLQPHFGPLRKISIEVKRWEVKWNIEAGITASFNPKVEVTGSYACALKLPELNIPIGGAAVPVSLRLKPDISATASASLKLDGPSLALEVGVQSSGRVYDDEYSCKWWRPCKHRLGFQSNTNPLARFKRGPASANLTGTLTFRAGVDANLGFGYNIGIAKARAGFSLVMSPLSAEIKAQAGTSSCASVSIGYQLDAALVAEAYIPIILDEEKRYSLYESGHKGYPGATFVVGDCG